MKRKFEQSIKGLAKKLNTIFGLFNSAEKNENQKKFQDFFPRNFSKNFFTKIKMKLQLLSKIWGIGANMS